MAQQKRTRVSLFAQICALGRWSSVVSTAYMMAGLSGDYILMDDRRAAALLGAVEALTTDQARMVQISTLKMS